MWSRRGSPSLCRPGSGLLSALSRCSQFQHSIPMPQSPVCFEIVGFGVGGRVDLLKRAQVGNLCPGAIMMDARNPVASACKSVRTNQ
jgi:hypothetical protein